MYLNWPTLTRKYTEKGILENVVSDFIASQEDLAQNACSFCKADNRQSSLDQLVSLKILIYDSKIVEFLPLAETTGQVKTQELDVSHPLSCKRRSKYAGREAIKQRCT